MIFQQISYLYRPLNTKAIIMSILKIFFSFSLCTIALVSCNSNAGQGTTDSESNLHTEALAQGQEHSVTAEESINTQNYTYVRATIDGKTLWMAVPKQDIEIGKTYYFTEHLLMEDFHSTELNRDFKQIYFLPGFYTEAGNPESMTETTLSGMETDEMETEAIDVTHAEGTVKLSDLLAKPEAYKGKKVKVTGQCVKFNEAIMNRNWVHIKDGSSGNPELTITTKAKIKVGDVVTFEGVIALNREFGAGYSYPVILEEAVIRQ